MQMKAVAAIAALGVALSGCAHKSDIWDKPGGTASQFNQDLAGCKMYASGAPQQHTQTNVYVAQTYVHGNYARTTVGPDPYAQLGAAIGDAIANGVQHMQAVRLCMESNGYTRRKS